VARLQESFLNNIERMLRKSGGALDELGAYLNDLNVFPTFMFGAGRYERDSHSSTSC
jgi:hypothetical protein